MMRVTGPTTGIRSGFMPQVLRAAHMDAGGRPAAVNNCAVSGSSALKKLSIVRPDNHAAFNEIRTGFGYSLMPGTSNVLLINRDRMAALLKDPATILITDWDETVSLIKCGWPAAMISYVAKMWAMPSKIEYEKAWEQPVTPTALDTAFAEEFVRRTTGTLTRVQFATAIWLKQFRDPINGGIDRDKFELAQVGILKKGELDFTEPVGQPWDAETGKWLYTAANGMFRSWKAIMKAEFRDQRLKELNSGISEPEEYLTGEVLPCHAAIKQLGIPLFGLSGSAEDEVIEDAEALRTRSNFKIIFGDNGILEKEHGIKYTKRTGSEYVMESEGIAEANRGRVIYKGDGPSEIEIGRGLGGFCVGFVPRHIEKPIELARTLIEKGADVLILEDYSDWPVFVPQWFANLKGE